MNIALMPKNTAVFNPTQQEPSELNIIARRHGFEPLLIKEDQQSTKSIDKARWSKSDVFFSKVDSDGSVQLDDDDTQACTFCYLCSINGHAHERTKPREESKRRKLIPYTNPKARTVSIGRVMDDPSSLSSYRIVVRTGTRQNSGTRAQVFLYIYGTEKNWTSIPLRSSSGAKTANLVDGFPQGSSRTFCLKGPDIGQLHHLNVSLVGNRSNKEWFLQEIEVTNLSTSLTWLCEFNCWLPNSDLKEQVQVTLSDRQPRESSPKSTAAYLLRIRTGDKPLVDIDASIQIMVRGSAAQTQRLPLTNSKTALFEQNSLDTFVLVGSDLGDLLEIVIESSQRPLTSNWDIKDVVMRRIIPSETDKQVEYYFSFNSCLSSKINMVKAKQESHPITDHHFYGPICYQVRIKTGQAVNAGTNANVYLIIYGKNGRTINHQLNTRTKSDFQRNTITEILIMDIDVGKIDGIKIWHDNSKPDSDWFIESIAIVKKHSTCHTISNIYTQRIKQITNVLYRGSREQRPTKSSSSRGKEHLSVDRGDSKLKHSASADSHERLGSSRSILRSPTLYEKVNLHKKVTWDEQSINSQDDSLSMESERRSTTTTRANISDEKYQLQWISSHSYRDNQWTIRSIEEKQSFDFDQSTRALLLSDRLPIRASDRSSDDEIYQFDAQRWLAKDKEDAKLGVFLTPTKSRSPMPADAARVPVNRPLQQSKSGDLDVASSQQLKPVSRSVKDLNSSLPVTSQLIGPIRAPTSALRPSVQSTTFPPPLKAPLKPLEDPTRIKSRMSLLPPSVASDPRLKSPREMNHPLASTTSRHSPSGMRSEELSHLSRSSPVGEHLKSAPYTRDSIGSLTREQELLARISGQPLHHSRLSNLPASVSTHSSRPPLNDTKRTTAPFPSQSTILQSLVSRSHTHSVTDGPQILGSISRDPLKNPPEAASHGSLSRNKERIDPFSRKPINRPPAQPTPMLPPHKSIHEQVYHSAYGTAPEDDF